MPNSFGYLLFWFCIKHDCHKSCPCLLFAYKLHLEYHIDWQSILNEHLHYKRQLFHIILKSYQIYVYERKPWSSMRISDSKYRQIKMRRRYFNALCDSTMLNCGGIGQWKWDFVEYNWHNQLNFLQGLWFGCYHQLDYVNVTFNFQL